MKSSHEAPQSLLSQLNDYFPGIVAGFNKTPASLFSLNQFESWWEAFFVTATYTVVSAVLAYMLNFLLALVAIIALAVSMTSLISSLVIRLCNKTKEGEEQCQMLFDLGVKSSAIFLMISFIPAFLTLGMICLAAYRSKNLINHALPQDASTKIQACVSSAYQSMKTSLSQLSVWASEKMGSFNSTPKDQTVEHTPF